MLKMKFLILLNNFNQMKHPVFLYFRLHDTFYYNVSCVGYIGLDIQVYIIHHNNNHQTGPITDACMTAKKINVYSLHGKFNA